MLQHNMHMSEKEKSFTFCHDMTSWFAKSE